MIESILIMLAGAVLGAGLMLILASRRVRVSIARAHHAQRRARAAERLAEIGSMTGGLAHEIKNPLSTIGLNAQLLKESIEDLEIDDAERSRLVRRIEALSRETERLRGILEDFLEFAGELQLSPAATRINSVLEELVDFFSPTAEGAGVRLRLETESSDPELVIDADHLKQALLNLMLNAVHAMEMIEGERELILRVERGVDATESPVVRLHITDTGPGMDAQTQEMIFHPYFTTRSGGSGLGLPTARRIIEGHGGHLELHSEPGKGSDFVIILPESVEGSG